MRAVTHTFRSRKIKTFLDESVERTSNKIKYIRKNKDILKKGGGNMQQNAQQILSQITSIARQLEQQEAQNAQMLRGQELTTQQQQQMGNLEQRAAEQLHQMQVLIQQYQQLNQQGFQSTTSSATGGVSGSGTVFSPGFAGTNAEEVRQQNQQSAQNQNGGNRFS